MDAPASGLPPGFTLDATPEKPPQKGLINEARSALEHTGPIGLGVSALLPGEPETAAGKFTKKAFELPEKLADKAGEKTAEASGSPALGAGVKTALMGATMLTPGGEASAAAKVAPKAATELEGLVSKAIGLGYKLKPSEAGGMAKAPGGTLTEGLSNSSKVEVAAVVHNQKITDKLALQAAQKAGVEKDARLSVPAIEKGIKENGKPYEIASRRLGTFEASPEYLEEVGKVGRRPGTTFQSVTHPEIERLKEGYAATQWNAKDVVFEVRKLRNSASRNITAREPERQELGYAQKAFANAMETELERQATRIGEPDLVKNLQAARKNIAILHDIKSSLRGNSADAKKIVKLVGRNPAVSGELKDIAEVAGEFPNVTRHANEVRQKVPVTVFEGAAGGYGAASHNPLLLGAAVARPLARKALLSNAYQRQLAKPHTLKSLTGTADKARRAALIGEEQDSAQ